MKCKAGRRGWGDEKRAAGSAALSCFQSTGVGYEYSALSAATEDTRSGERCPLSGVRCPNGFVVCGVPWFSVVQGFPCCLLIAVCWLLAPGLRRRQPFEAEGQLSIHTNMCQGAGTRIGKERIGVRKRLHIQSDVLRLRGTNLSR